MNFYHAYYKRQHYDKDRNLWYDTSYICQGIIVIADSYEEAKLKVEKCLAQVETGEYRVVLASDIVECIGLDRRHGFDWSFEMNPIINA